jgi:hypothetical protein
MRILLFLCLLVITVRAQDDRTFDTGTLRCAVHGPAGAYSHSAVRIGEKAYSVAIEIDNVVYLATEVGQGAFATRRFKSDDWVIGDPVQVSLDETKRKIYLRAPKGKDLVLGYRQRIRASEWEGCSAMRKEMGAVR